MYYPNLKDFRKLCKKGNVIPVYKEVSADLDTPVSAFLKLKKSEYSFLLESVEVQEKISRYSFLGTNPGMVFKSRGRQIELFCPQDKTTKSFTTDKTPFDEIKLFMQQFKSVQVKGLPRFFGGLVGYIGYDMVRFFERLPDKNPDDLKLADAVLMFTDTMLIFDHITHTIKIVTNVVLPQGSLGLSSVRKAGLYKAAILKIEEIHRQLLKPLTQFSRLSLRKNKPTYGVSNLKRTDFIAKVKKAKEYIMQGDIIQVVLSQRFSLPVKKHPFDIYRSLRSMNPSPYMFYLALKDTTLVGSSPEMLVRSEDGLAVTRPIAGTRPRGANDEEDNALAEELLNDPKEKAEHIMLVDLGRNDIGRVTQAGGVRVSNFMSVEKYSHVMHLVSEVRGRLAGGWDAYDALKACFPAGTVSGSPKIRAMEIIDELENTRRGPYAGCVGYFSFSHNMDTCITIRTIVINNRKAYIQAGAGIVADSIPEKEYVETMNKARALIEAIAS